MIEIAYKDFFVNQSLGTYGTDLFVRIMPDEPDNLVCLQLTTAPQGPEHQRYDLENTGMRVIVRGSHSFCEAKMMAIQKVVPQFTGTFDSIYIKSTLIQTPFAFIENDDMGRVVYSAVYESEYSLGATSRTSV